jgi:N-acetylmuramoyl-L-alanine amidase
VRKMGKWDHKYAITKFHLTAPSKRRSGIKMDKVLGIVAHDTGNPKSTAWQNVRYYENSRDAMSASAHFFVDDRDIIECIPAMSMAAEKAWHVLYNVETDNRPEVFGDDANDVAIGVELCYGGHINLQEAYKRYVYLMAYICDRYGIDPIKRIWGHYQLDPKRKTDPLTPLKLLGKTIDHLRTDVRDEWKRCRL